MAHLTMWKGSAQRTALPQRRATTGADPERAVGRHVGDQGGALLTEGVEEPLQGGLPPAGCGPHQPPGVVVDHHGQVTLPALVGDLVDPNPPQVGEPVMDGLHVGPDRVMIAPTVRQAIRISSVIALLGHWVASQATCSSKA